MRLEMRTPARPRLIIAVLTLALLALIGLMNDRPATVAEVGTTSAVVGIAQTPTQSPTDADIDAAVRQAIALAGGLPDNVGPGKLIVIQPNLVNAGSYSGGGAIPNAQVVRTIIHMCLEKGATWNNIIVCEGSAGFLGSMGSYGARQATRKALKDSGLDPDGDMYVESGGTHVAWCIDANYVGECTEVGNIGGAYPNYPHYRGQYNSSYVKCFSRSQVPGIPTSLVPNLYIDRVYALPLCVVNCDVLIRVPVLKNHNLAGITGALKLAYGHAPSDIYHLDDMPFYKWNLLHNPADWGGPEVEKNAMGMCDMTLLRPPDLVVTDGLVGVINGPVGGADGGGGTLNLPAGGKMACILAGTNPVAVDTIQALACGYRIDSIRGLTYGAAKGLGPNDPGKIEVRGVHVKDIRRAFPQWGCAIPSDDAEAPSLGGLSIPENTHVCGRLTIAPTGYTDDVIPGKTGSGICKGELYIDGRLVDSNDQSGYTTSWTVTNESEGAHTLTYTLYDRMLNETSVSRTVYVHRNDPVAASFALPDGAAISMSPVVFAGTACDGTFFVSSPDGLRGLRVYRAAGAPSVSPGRRLALYGTMTTVGGQRRLNCTSYSVLEAGDAPKARYMRNIDLGGTGYNASTFGVTGGVGPYNLGCLVRTSGRVTAGGSDYFWITDGSLANDPAGAVRLKVYYGTSHAAPPAGALVSVTGFSCCENDGGVIRRVLVMRGADDWRSY